MQPLPIRPLRLLAGILAIVFVAGCGPDARNQEDQMTDERTRLSMAIPPLDAEVPPNTETATFALG